MDVDGAVGAENRVGSVVLSRRSQGLVARLDRPEVANAVDPSIVEGLRAAIDQVQADPSIRSLAILGAPGAFCAGADLAHTTSLLEAGDHDQLASFLSEVAATLTALESVPVPVIAVVDGPAMAGGFEVALACDLVLASSRASFADAHVAHGFIPGWHSTVRAPRKLGLALATRMILTGVTVRPEEMGSFVTEIVDPEDLDECLSRWMRRVASNGPEAMARSKALLAHALEDDAAQAAARETRALRIHLRSPELAEGARAFLDHRRAEFPDPIRNGSAE